MNTRDRNLDFDVCMLGGGLASLTLAIQLLGKLPGLRILILEKDTHPAPTAAFKVGESSVEISGHYFGELLGLKEHIKAEQLPKLGLRFFFRKEGIASLSEGIELGGSTFWPTPSYQFDRGIFETYLAKRATELGATFRDGARVLKIELDRKIGHSISYILDGEHRTVFAKWVVDGSGRAGLLKRKLDLKSPSSHKANSAWFRVDERIEIDEWLTHRKTCDLPEDHGPRWLSTNHLMGPGYWVWLIPLSSGSTSIGIVADDKIQDLREYNSLEKALSWLERNEPVLSEHLSESKPRIQDFKVLKHYSHSSKQVFSEDRWALTGEAGIFTDPFYSPGSDLIAISNTLICDLIVRDLQHDRFESRVRVYDELYRSIATETFRVFENQYCFWGHARVMPLKIIWDFSFYWCGIASLFFHGVLHDLNLYLLIRKSFGEMNTLSAEMQVLFRTWFEALDSDQREFAQFEGAYLDLTSVEPLYRLNEKLIRETPKDELSALFKENLTMLKKLAAEIAGAALEDLPDLHIPEAIDLQDADPEYLGSILSSLPRMKPSSRPVDTVVAQ